ncbi:MAG: FtsX-like permease family protein, partial [Gammaproteobacteria bacterium]
TIGTVLGIAAGTVIGRLLLSSVSETISRVYFPVGPSALIVETPQLIKALLLGIGASVLAVLAPAYEATRLSPVAALTRSQLETGARRLIQLSALAGSLAIISGLAISVFSAASVRLGLAGIIVLLFGFALLTPAAALWLMQALRRLCRKKLGVIGTLPLRLVAAEISRTGVAMAALMVAVAATIGMDLMITSFRQTVSDWIQTSLQGDLYIAVSGNLAAAGKARQDLELKSALASLPDVEMLSSVLRTQLPSSAGPVPAAVFELNPRSRAGFIVLDGAGDVWERLEREQGVWVTEAFAYHHQVGVGDELTLLAPQGPAIFKVIAVYADYTGDRGHIAMSRRQYLRHWPDLGFTGIGVYAMTHADLPRIERAIRLKLSARQTVKSARAIYEASMAVFEQTFAITEILRGLASGIAVIGVFGALTSLQFERARQIGILRSIGLTPAQICRLIVSETGLMGLIAGLIALPVGYLLAYQLIFVVYRRSFGWTLAFHFDPAVLLQGLFLAIAAAFLAGLWPAWKMAHGNPAEALRTE